MSVTHSQLLIEPKTFNTAIKLTKYEKVCRYIKFIWANADATTNVILSRPQINQYIVLFENHEVKGISVRYNIGKPIVSVRTKTIERTDHVIGEKDYFVTTHLWDDFREFHRVNTEYSFPYIDARNEVLNRLLTHLHIIATAVAESAYNKQLAKRHQEKIQEVLFEELHKISRGR
jgi:hypothetical protein